MRPQLSIYSYIACLPKLSFACFSEMSTTSVSAGFREQPPRNIFELLQIYSHLVNAFALGC